MQASLRVTCQLSLSDFNHAILYQDISAEVPNIQVYEDLFPGSQVIKSGRQLCTQADRHTSLQAKTERRRIYAIHPYERAIEDRRRK
jgi:hypothetical protein